MKKGREEHRAADKDFNEEPRKISQEERQNAHIPHGSRFVNEEPTTGSGKQEIRLEKDQVSLNVESFEAETGNI